MFFLGLQAMQGVHLLEDWLKKSSEEADEKKPLWLVLESNIQEKNWEVVQAEKKLATTERARAFVDQKVEVLQGMVEESDTKLV